MLQGGAGPLTSELQLGRVAGPLQASGTSMDGKRKAEMCQQTHPRTKMLEIPRVLTCNSQDPPSLLPAPLKASSGCSGERWDAGPSELRRAQPSSEPPLQAGGRGWGSTCGREKGLWGQNLSVVSAQLKRKNEQLVLDLPWYPRPPGQYPGGGARGRLSLSPPPPPLPLAEDTKSSRKEILLSLFQVFFFSFKISLRQKFGKASLHKAARRRTRGGGVFPLEGPAAPTRLVTSSSSDPEPHEEAFF